jgi:hypothetical protein
MEAFMAATAAARDLTAAIKAAQVFGLVLAVGVGDSFISRDGLAEIHVYLTGNDAIAEDSPPDEA